MDALGARRYPWLWAAAIPMLLLALVRLLGVERGFPLVPLIAYVPYVAAALLLLAGAALALRNWAAAAVAAAGAACLLALILPRGFGATEPAHPGGTELRLLSANILHGTADPEALVEMAGRYDADLLSVQELTPSFARRLRRAGIERALPHAVLSVRRGSSGGGLYSRLPIDPIAMPAAAGPPSARFRMPRGRLQLSATAAARVVAVHPYPPLRRGTGRWRDELESLPEAGGRAPWILAGDFNATLDHAELRELVGSGYRDAAEVAGLALEPTWPAGFPWPPPVTIDHVLADERIRILEYAVEDLAGSDHRTVFVRLSLPG